VLILFSGAIGVGKTTLCLCLAGLARRRSCPVLGVLTPAIVRDGVKVGIEALNLRTGETRPLARRAALQDSRFRGTRVGRYAFDDLVLDWVVSFCTRALANADADPGIVVFLDEIGKIELDTDKGLAPLIPLLARPRKGRVIAIVRDTLLDRLLAHLVPAEPRVVLLKPLARETAWGELTSLVFGEGLPMRGSGGADRH
jgi:nucleoside-triphosphatase THEP1